jgi:hypothetical protein
MISPFAMLFLAMSGVGTFLILITIVVLLNKLIAAIKDNRIKP